jgi:hypothetical protein
MGKYDPKDPVKIESDYSHQSIGIEVRYQRANGVGCIRSFYFSAIVDLGGSPVLNDFGGYAECAD